MMLALSVSQVLRPNGGDDILGFCVDALLLVPPVSLYRGTVILRVCIVFF